MSIILIVIEISWCFVFFFLSKKILLSVEIMIFICDNEKFVVIFILGWEINKNILLVV